MKRLLPFSITVFSLLLAGCEEQSDVFPADGREFDAEGYVTTTPYTGRVIDGYLRNARVWLDMDGDGQYTPGPLAIENSAGTELVLPDGEPTAMSGQDGRFSLDVMQLEQDPLVAPDLDPRDYPLFALALPGQTIEQTGSGERLVEDAFMMSAPPGVRNVTPLTTLVRQRRVNGIGEFLAGTTELARALGNVNLVSDFVQSGDVRAQTYARAFARFLSSQLPQAYKDLLENSDGRDRFLSGEAVKLMGISLALNALEIVQAVDEAAADGDYGSVDVDSLVLPVVDLELDDSVLISRQQVYARAATLPTSFSGLELLSEITFNYAENGQLTSVESDGCMSPSLREMVRVINADGRMAATGTQWVPTVSLNQSSGTFLDQEGVDERLTFDWKDGTAAFETTTTCHPGLASSSELGGPPAIEYTWTLSNGRVTSLTAAGNGRIEVFTPDYRFGDGFFFGYTRSVNGEDEEILTPASARQSCEGSISDADAVKPLVVSAAQPYGISGTLTTPNGFDSLAYELDARDGLERPLRFGFVNEKFVDNDEVTNTAGFQWQFYYPAVGSENFVEEQPNLVSSAYIARYSGDRNCGRDFESIPVSAYARVQYSYLRLSEYLAGRVE